MPSQSPPPRRRRRDRSASPPPTNRHVCLWMFTSLLWGTFFSAAILLAVVVQGYPGMVKQADTDARPRLYRAKELVGIMHEIRQGDWRLVRSSVAGEETQVEQHRWCPIKMAAFLMTLCTSTANGRSQGKMTVSLHTRGLAAESIALCLTDQPQFRDLSTNTTFLSTALSQIQQDQLVAHNLADGLTVLLKEGIHHYQTYRDGGAVIALAQAAETVWVASFHYPPHIQEFLNQNTIAVLGEIIVSNRPDQFKNNHTMEYPYHPARAVMWACAALQNLAANYCDNELGYCLWQWQQQNTTTNGQPQPQEPQLGLDETVLVRPELAAQARQQIAAVPQLLETLADWICLVGPIHATPNETYGWPGDVQLWKDLTFNAQSLHLQSPSIVPWAAAGVLKNLLLGKDDTALQRRIRELPHNVSQCLCRMMRESPDWLEHGQAADAVSFWGPPSEAICGGSIYDTCQDDTEWNNVDSQDTCADYTRERWCLEYGDDVDENGKTAKEACCACGGGLPKDSGKAPENTQGEDIGERVQEQGKKSDDPQHEEL